MYACMSSRIGSLAHALLSELMLDHTNADSVSQLLKADVQCMSDDTLLGDFNTLAECANACQKRFLLLKRLCGHFCVVLSFDCLKILQVPS